MSKWGRLRSAAGFVCVLLGVGLGSSEAQAYELKHTTTGKPVKWTEQRVVFVVDPTISQAAAGGGDAVKSAMHSWSGAGGAPVLVVAPGSGGGKAAMDGQNTILFARDGFAPAGNALAVTIVSYIEETGAILDADIVVNGKHSFAVLRANTLNDQTKPVSTDGADPSEEEGNQPFDLWHVASHETGHALGLGDVQTNHGAVMYAYSSPGDASNRAPASDDDDGIDAVYGGSVSRSGCGASSVAGTRMRAVDGQVAALLVLGCVARLTLRRRALRAVPVAAALLALTLDPSSAHSASLLPASRVASQATATVVGVATRDVGGVFETTLDLAPAECRSETCPALSRAHAWGGTLGGITQQVGEVPAPKLGERVEVSFSASQERVYEGIPAATLLFRSGSALSR